MTAPATTVGLILAGGRGTRLRDRHPGLPKPMIPCRGRPFIEWVVRYFAGQGVDRFVVSVGHLAEVAEAHFRDRLAGAGTVATVREAVPLGTGGGVRLAWQSVPDADVVVANGDSLVLADLAPAWALFARPEVEAVILGVHQDDASRYGTLRTGADGRLLAFEEKRPGAGLVNAGVYLLKARLRETLSADTPLSIETDVIPRWLTDGTAVYVHAYRAPFIDIGTPDSLDAAEAFLASHFPVTAARPAAFLDRDGTLIEEVNYLAHPDQVRLLPGAAGAVARLNRLGIPVVVVTNQAGVARGYFPESRVEEVHARLDELLRAAGARIDGYYVCPHHPTAGVNEFHAECECRKPKPGLLRRAAGELELDLAGSCMIGDKLSDLEAGARAGCRSVLVRTGHGETIDPAAVPASWGVLGVADSLAEAVELWLRAGRE